MNISTDTLSVLKNFSDINQNILVKPGNTIQTISTMKNILAEAEVSEKFDSEFAIYLSLIHISEPTRLRRISYAVV